MYKTVIRGNERFGLPIDTPNHVIAAIPDLTGNATAFRVILPDDREEIILPAGIRDVPPPLDQKTIQYGEDLIRRNRDPEPEDDFDEMAADRVQNAVDLVLLDVIHDHVDQVLEATVQKATLSVLAEYLKDDEVN